VPDVKVTDRSLIWNSDLVETLEIDNLIAQAVVTMHAPPAAPKLQRAAREDDATTRTQRHASADPKGR
jgi:succinate dehydrogenase / fumarate reductase flavoprotein subunit